MSSPPSSPRRYYASRPSSRPTSPPVSSQAEIRSQAVAKLKRAASLPRQANGRRPSQSTADAAPVVELGTPVASSSTGTFARDADPAHAAASSAATFDPPGEHGEQEVLSASPGHGALYHELAAAGMPRSVSSSSSFEAPSPANMSYASSPFYTASSSPANTPDWAAMQLAHSYLPSLSPVTLSPGPMHTGAAPGPAGIGRNTPSPLPSLGELGALSRSNSAAARAKAMSKLTGGRDTPDAAGSARGSGGVRLQRSGTLGAPRLAPLVVDQAPTMPAATVDEAVLQPRPRLQRSFTVSCSNMGEERRSAVGRRMVERLAERKAAREREEAEVRQLWETRRAQTDNEHQFDDADEPGVDESNAEAPLVPVNLHEASPTEPPLEPGTMPSFADTLPVNDRAPSRATEHSNGDAFEYEAHLRRSLSSRTARNELAEAQPLARPSLDETVERLNAEAHLPPPVAAYVTPTKHMQHPSISSQATIHANNSPAGASSISGDGLNSMMFVMGSAPSITGSNGSPANGNWPSEVEEHSTSDWGTPGKLDAPEMHDVEEEGADSLSDSQAYDSRTQSVMSWEEVGGAEDREVPINARYHKKSGSVSVKMGRAMKEAMRKRSQSRGSGSSIASPPTSPRQLVTAFINRRGSQSSTSPSQQTATPSLEPRHQPSLNSLAPSGPAESANSILLQHQLAGEATPPVSFLPRADLSDPRIHSAKLSPFPGIATLESHQQRDGMAAPRMVQQASDSAVPSAQRVQPPEPIYSLPPPAPPATSSRRESADSTGKRSWLAKAFGHSSRSSASMSRSNSDQGHDASPDIDADPFAAPPAPVRQPTILEEQRLLPPKSMDVLARMDKVLALAPDDPARPDILDDPPRKLLLATQVLQVVNVHTVKDRFLLLFNDILVIAKPLITQGTVATLDLKFVVKSVVALDKLVVSGISTESATEPPRHPVVQSFIGQFTADPMAAVRYLVERSNPRVDLPTVASLIFKTPELDKTQIGVLLAANEPLLRSFMERFHFAGVRIDDALRMLLLALRLPTDIAAAEALLRGFAEGYHTANRDIAPFHRELCAELVLSMLELNDSLYDEFGFAFPNHAITRETFVAAFRAKDPRALVPDGLLGAVFDSIEGSRLVQALSRADAAQARAVVVTPARLPSKLTFQAWSDPITVRIPAPDRDFAVKLIGAGLEFDPPVLDFAQSSEQAFRVKGVALGVKSILFDRVGANAALYAGVGNTRTVSIERAFMRHTFHIAFVSHTGLKRKYCFSVADAPTRAKWAGALSRQIRTTRDGKAAARAAAGVQDRVRAAAEAVSLQVLRDALIPPDDPAAPHAAVSLASVGPGTTGAVTNGTLTPSKRNPNMRLQRSGSVSVVYTPSGLDDAGAPQASAAAAAAAQATRHLAEVQAGMVEVQTGKELVLLCRQNSLLPGLLELLQGGVEPGTAAGVGGPALRARMQGTRV